MGRIYVGTSQFPSLRGIDQFAEERAGLQILMVLAIVNAQLPRSEWVYINEAQRPRASQRSFWNAMVRRGAPPAVVAARLYTSKHDGGPNDDQGRAFDLGGPGGQVITDRAHALIKSVGAAYGIHHTGAGFRPAEKWHFEYVPGTARLLASAGPTLQEIEEEHMTAQLYVHPNGTIAALDLATGWEWWCPNPAYGQLLRNMRAVPDKDPVIMTNEQWDFAIARVRETKQALANTAAMTVWSQQVTAADGTSSAGFRLSAAQIDSYGARQDIKGMKTGGSVSGLDVDSLVARILAGVGELIRSIFTKAGTK